MECTEVESRDDCEVVYVHGAVVSTVAQFLDTAVHWVWILGHRPNRYVQWWKTSVNINANDTQYSGLVRNMCFDLQLPTHEFLMRVTEFDDHGIVLIQSHRMMPDTLCLDTIPEAQRNSVLTHNGATLRICLPHAIETAQVQSFSKGYLGSVIST